MRRVSGLAAVAAVTLLPALAAAQQQAGDASHAVTGGGVMVPGWQAVLDPKEAGAGATIAQSRLAKDGNDLKVTTGPAIAYYQPGDVASGNYTVKATFNEPAFQGLNSHPHPYGVFIGGNDLNTPNASYFYCSAYGSGKFIARGFGPAVFMMNGGGGEVNAAVHKAEAKGKPVSQEIALTVNGDKVECAINGTVVGTYNKSDIVGAGKLKSTDGVYGIRFAHNTEAVVSGLTMTKK